MRWMYDGFMERSQRNLLRNENLDHGVWHPTLDHATLGSGTPLASHDSVIATPSLAM